MSNSKEKCWRCRISLFGKAKYYFTLNDEKPFSPQFVDHIARSKPYCKACAERITNSLAAETWLEWDSNHFEEEEKEKTLSSNQQG
jgi:hypothetical protein